YQAADALQLYGDFKVPGFNYPEPVHCPWGSPAGSRLGETKQSNVTLTGLGGDPAFSSQITVHFRQLFERRQLSRMLSDGASYLAAEGRFSRLYLRTRWRLFSNPRGERPGYPPWLKEDFEKQLSLQE